MKHKLIASAFAALLPFSCLAEVHLQPTMEADFQGPQQVEVTPRQHIATRFLGRSTEAVAKGSAHVAVFTGIAVGKGVAATAHGTAKGAKEIEKGLRRAV
jgi:hypothetical protein